jgi:hypothetical protein
VWVSPKHQAYAIRLPPSRLQPSHLPEALGRRPSPVLKAIMTLVCFNVTRDCVRFQEGIKMENMSTSKNSFCCKFFE